jgi:hypothetical protein
MAVIQNIAAKILIQVGQNEPHEIGTIEIPIELVLPGKKPPAGPTYRKLSDSPQA